MIALLMNMEHFIPFAVGQLAGSAGWRFSFCDDQDAVAAAFYLGLGWRSDDRFFTSILRISYGSRRYGWDRALCRFIEDHDFRIMVMAWANLRVAVYPFWGFPDLFVLFTFDPANMDLFGDGWSWSWLCRPPAVLR
jgi:hypothetical protein